MGVHLDELDDHEGYAARQLPNERTGTSTPASFDAYVAACSCGWRGSTHPPDEHGRERAETAWVRDHARPLLAGVVPPQTRQAVSDARREIADLTVQRPRAALQVLEELTRWAQQTLERTAGSIDTTRQRSVTGPPARLEQRHRRGRGLTR